MRKTKCELSDLISAGILSTGVGMLILSWLASSRMQKIEDFLQEKVNYLLSETPKTVSKKEDFESQNLNQLLSQKKYEETVTVPNLMPENPELLYHTAIFILQQKNLSEGSNIAQNTSEENSDLVNKISEMTDQLGKVRDILQKLKKDNTPSSIAYAHSIIAEQEYQGKRLESAEQLIKKAIELKEKPPFYRQLEKIYAAQGKLSDAKQARTKAEQLSDLELMHK